VAGGDIRISAAGAKDASNLTIQGSQIEAAGITTLKADNAITLQASQSTSTLDQATNFSTNTAGVSMHSNTGIGAAAGLGSGQRHTHAIDQTFTNTHINGQTGEHPKWWRYFARRRCHCSQSNFCQYRRKPLQSQANKTSATTNLTNKVVALTSLYPSAQDLMGSISSSKTDMTSRICQRV
jgi:hypothetical protein